MTDIKQLLKEFERFAYGQSLHGAFVELLDWTLLPFKKWDSAERQNTALETYQSHPKVQQLKKLVTLIGDLSEDFNDPPGELYASNFKWPQWSVFHSNHNVRYDGYNVSW